ncbi:MAG TPA: YihY/virulence factor BrkB family protein [Patescibacteria group bacterium]|nr:YihY/virulence factor BrkB family protein [Patescibacteria group bacterium]
MTFLSQFGRAVRRVFPRTAIYAQALAFNLFLTLFPLLLFCVALLAGSKGANMALEELLRDRWMLPSISRELLFTYLHQHNVNPGRWLVIGLVGTLLAGTQCMNVLLETFRAMEGAERRPFWRHALQAMGLLCVALIPALAEVVFTVFGRLVRVWLARNLGLPTVLAIFWVIFGAVTAWIFAVLILTLLYRAGQPCIERFRDGLPGAVLATAFWVVANVLFGAYMTRAPYGPIYGGLAAIIVLLLWLQLSTVGVFLGAAYNAEKLGVPPLR